MIIQQMLPPQKPLLLHIIHTSDIFVVVIDHSFQDIPQRKKGAAEISFFVDSRLMR